MIEWRFERYDANEDGKLNEDEIRQVIGKRVYVIKAHKHQLHPYTCIYVHAYTFSTHIYRVKG